MNTLDRISRRQILKAGVLGGVATGIAACTPAAASLAPSASTQPADASTAPASPTTPPELPLVTLRLLNLGGADTEVLGEVETTWNAQSTSFKVKFEQSTTTSDKIVPLGITQLGGNNPPDLAFCSIGGEPGNSQPLREAGLLLDLTPYAAKYGWEQRFSPDFWSQFVVDGKVTQIATSSLSWSYYYYNPEIFAAAGITVPEGRLPTKEEFASWRDKVKAKGFEFIALGNKEMWPAFHHLANMHRALVTKDRLALLFDNVFRDTGAKYTDPDAIRAIKRTQDTFKEGYFAPGPNVMTDGEALALFTSGKAAIFQSGFWGAYVIPPAAPKGFKFDLFHWPVEDPAVPKAIFIGVGGGYMLSSKTKYPDEATAILDFLISKPGQQIYIGDHGILPSVNGATLPAADTVYPEPKAIFAAIVDAQNRFANDSGTFLPGAGISVITDPISTQLQLLIDGTMTPEDFGAKIQQFCEEYRAAHV